MTKILNATIGLVLVLTLLVPVCPAFGLSVPIDPSGEQQQMNSIVENSRGMTAYEDAFRRAYRYISVRVSGTAITVAVLDGHNQIVRNNATRWHDIFPDWAQRRADTSSENACTVVSEIVKKIVATIADVGGPVINQVSVTVTGPVDKDFGIVGTDFPCPTLPFYQFPFLKEFSRILRAEGITAQVAVKKTTEAELDGETIAPRGLLRDVPSGCAIIVSNTSVDIGVKNDGVFYTGMNGEIREVGHKIIQVRRDEADTGLHFAWVGHEAGPYHPIEKGRPQEKICQKSGAMGVKYLADEKKFRERYAAFPIIDYAAGLRDFEDIVSGEHINARLERNASSYLIQHINYAALNGKAATKAHALKDIRDIACTIAKGTAAFVAAYRDETFVEHMVLCGAVAEIVGRGVYEQAGDNSDIFMTTFRAELVRELTEYFGVPQDRARTIARGVRRSKMDEQRELISHTPTMDEMRFFKMRNPLFEVQRKTYATELEQVEDMIQRVKKEIAYPGTGQVPKKIAMSDFHGASDVFFTYIAHAIYRDTGIKIRLDDELFANGVSIREQLAGQGIYDIKNTINFTFYFLGDFSDRGKYGLRCFRAAKELKKLGVAEIVFGNHDIWWGSAVLGAHLPLDDKYHIYPECGHQESARLLKEHANEFSTREQRFKEWSKRLLQYRRDQETMQKATVSVNGQRMSVDDILIAARQIYDRVDAKHLSGEELILLNDLVGKNISKVDIGTGFRAAGLMSDQWWQERLILAGTMRARYAETDEMYAVWHTLYTYTEKVSTLFAGHLAEMKKHYWWWQVFNDIHHLNYTSPEWYALDWLYHKEWGPNLIAEMNAMEQDPDVRWDETNFFEHPAMKEFATFFKEDFSLSIKDEYGIRYPHGWFPFDEKTGRIAITYKGVEYKDYDLWRLLHVLEDDMRRADSLTDAWEAWDLIMSWYADNTIKIKPVHIAQAIETFGLPRLLTPVGLRIFPNGHNPQNEMLKKNIGFMVYDMSGYAAVFTDKGMVTEKYKDVGCYIEFSRNGIKAYGFNGPKKDTIVENPHTMTIVDGKIVSGVANAFLERLDFLHMVLKQLNEARERLLAERAAAEKDILSAA